jgi:hypothetical protein
MDNHMKIIKEYESAIAEVDEDISGYKSTVSDYNSAIRMLELWRVELLRERDMKLIG